MDHATMSKGFLDRKGLQEIGAIEVPWGQVGGIQWAHISKDCLPVIVYKSSAPKAVICANRFQLETLLKIDHEYVKECFIVEIVQLMKHSNLSYCEDMIEKDRKFRHKKKSLMAPEKKALMKDIITQLNRTRTAQDIAAAYKIATSSVIQMSVKLRKAPYNFNIPTIRGYDDFNVFAEEIAKENPSFVKKPLASKPNKIPIKLHSVKIAHVNGN